jgi:hypothetical protein
MARAIPGAASELETLQSAVSATGNGGVLGCLGMSTVVFLVTGTFTATVTFEGSIDEGTTWHSLEMKNVATGAKSTTATAAGAFKGDCAGMERVRARVTWSAGTSVTVKARALPIIAGEMTADIDASGATIQSEDTPDASGTSATTAPTNATTTAVAASAVVKASAGTLFGASGYNTAAATRYIMFFDATSVPTDGAVTPAFVVAVAADSSWAYDPGIYGRRFATGICWASSTTEPFTKTIEGAAAQFADVQYV